MHRLGGHLCNAASGHGAACPVYGVVKKMLHQERVKKTFCTTREAAQLLGVSLRTAQLWVERGLLEAWKTGGGHRRISRDSINRLLADPGERAVGSAGDHTAAAATDAPLSVMVVEDEAALRRVYELTLTRWPSQPKVVTVGDGYEALVRLGLSRPDMLITDLRMPGMDGVRMLRSIRETPELAGMAIVVVTGLDPAEIEELGGVPDDIPVLPKPIPFDHLRELFDRFARARQTRNPLP